MAHGQTGKKRAAPFSLRLTFDERAQLEKNAGGMPVGAYIKSRCVQQEEARVRLEQFRAREAAEMARLRALQGQQQQPQPLPKIYNEYKGGGQ